VGAPLDFSWEDVTRRFFVLTHSVILRIGSTVVDIRTQVNTNNYYATPAASAELCALLSAVPAVFHGFGFATQ